MVMIYNDLSVLMYLLIQSATSGIYKAIGDKARSVPGQIYSDNKFLSKLETGHYAYPFVRE